ncbi:MAG TPA: peptide chain release factor N(5)-glutamine methyltransferase [Candidatus Binatia bacterium]|nr:peptide chain release factor N(5)-glutamine methyltransferase [Candidatus Binatia bacterium]
MEMQGMALRSEAKSARHFLLEGARKLVRAGVETARLDAEVMLAHALGMAREQLVSSSNLCLSGADIRRYEELLRRRVAREPVAYIIGRQEFWSLDFRVTPDVLIPRPETERLVEMVIDLVGELTQERAIRILDIGTGSGAIAVSLAKELPKAVIWATDTSAAALKIANGNTRYHCLTERIKLLQGDLFTPVREIPENFDLIVSNPPYVVSAEIATLEPEVSRWEPRGALDGGADGLDFYRRIAAQAHAYLARRGAVALEIGADRGKEVSRLFSDTGYYTDVRVVQDYAGRDRVMVTRTQANSA